MASNSFVISRQYGSNEAPGKRAVKLDATASVGIGNMIVEVAGYGQIPAAANAATGHMAGITLEVVDNSAGAAGALSVTVEPRTARFANDGGNPCTQAHVGLTVYASDEFTISSNSADGPPAGKLIRFDSTDYQGRPCEVALNCFTS